MFPLQKQNKVMAKFNIVGNAVFLKPAPMDKILCNMSEYKAKSTQLPATPVIINFDQQLAAT